MQMTWRVAAALSALAGAAVAPATASANVVRTASLHRGVTNVNLMVPQVSGARPPAIALSPAATFCWTYRCFHF
jgi:hypothetical protein